MNGFDLWIMHHVNSLVNRWWIVDVAVVQTSYLTLLKGGVLMSMFWWAWVEHGKEHPEKREILALTLVATVCAVMVSRALAISLPYRERPLHDPRLHYHLAYTQDPNWLIHWSSFPSDHAAVYFCVAAGLWLVSRRLGALASVYALLASLPRVYLGFHYPTDIVGGALAGVGCAMLAQLESLRRAARWTLRQVLRKPSYLYAGLFVFTFEVGEMFNSFQGLLILGADVCRKLPRSVWKGCAATVLGALARSVARKRHTLPEPEVRAAGDHSRAA